MASLDQTVSSFYGTSLNISFFTLLYDTDTTLTTSQGSYPGSQKQTALIRGSDAGGIVDSTGLRVTRFKVGDRVLSLFPQGHFFASLDTTFFPTGVDGQVDNVLRTDAVFHESGLVRCRSNLSFEDAATLPCTAATIWNALYGSEGQSPKLGSWILTQVTGAVSLFGCNSLWWTGACLRWSTCGRRINICGTKITLEKLLLRSPQ